MKQSDAEHDLLMSDRWELACRLFLLGVWLFAVLLILSIEL